MFWAVFSPATPADYVLSNPPNPDRKEDLWAADIGNAGFRAHWIAEAVAVLAHGYRGLYLDYVNMTLEEITDGNGNVTTPIDPRTGQPMTLAA
jgi:hypothetical protein